MLYFAPPREGAIPATIYSASSYVGPERLFLTDENAGPRGPATLVITIGRTTKQQAIMIDENRCHGREIGYW